MRAAQNFESFQIDKIPKGNAGAGLIYAVDEHADRAFEAGIVTRRADTADLDRCALRFGLRRLDVEARRNRSQVFDIGNSLTLERLGGDRGHGEGNVLDIHRTQGCRHNDGFVAGILFGLGCFLRINGRNKHRAAQRSRQYMIKSTHLSLLLNRRFGWRHSCSSLPNRHLLIH